MYNFCWLGWHRWSKWQDGIKKWQYLEGQHRICKSCGKRQEETY